MKRLILLFVLCYSITSASAFTTEASKYAEKEFSQLYNCENSRIQVTKEFISEYQQKVGEHSVPAIAYGYGYLKTENCKKQKITYICLLDENCKPIWSCVINEN